MCAYSVFNTFPVYPLSAKPLILLAFCRYRYHTSLFDRPGFKRMIEDIEKKEIGLVLTKDLSRLGRDYIKTGQYTELFFPSRGVRFIAVGDGYDSAFSSTDLIPFRNVVKNTRHLGGVNC